MKKFIAVFLIMLIALPLAFAESQFFSETTALVSLNVSGGEAVQESPIDRVAIVGNGKFYLGESMFRGVIGFGSSFDVYFNDVTGDKSIKLGLGLEAEGGVSMVLGKNGLFRIDLVAGAYASENGWIRNLFAKLFDSDQPPVYFSGAFGDLSALFGDEDICIRAGLRIGPSMRSTDTDAHLAFTPYVALEAGLFNLFF